MKVSKAQTDSKSTMTTTRSPSPSQIIVPTKKQKTDAPRFYGVRGVNVRKKTGLPAVTQDYEVIREMSEGGSTLQKRLISNNTMLVGVMVPFIATLGFLCR